MPVVCDCKGLAKLWSISGAFAFTRVAARILCIATSRFRWGKPNGDQKRWANSLTQPPPLDGSTRTLGGHFHKPKIFDAIVHSGELPDTPTESIFCFGAHLHIHAAVFVSSLAPLKTSLLSLACAAMAKSRSIAVPKTVRFQFCADHIVISKSIPIVLSKVPVVAFASPKTRSGPFFDKTLVLERSGMQMFQSMRWTIVSVYIAVFCSMTLSVSGMKPLLAGNILQVGARLERTIPAAMLTTRRI